MAALLRHGDYREHNATELHGELVWASQGSGVWRFGWKSRGGEEEGVEHEGSARVGDREESVGRRRQIGRGRIEAM